MSQDIQDPVSTSPSAPTKDKEQHVERVVVHAYPSTIYLWPSMVVGYIVFFIDYFIRFFSEANATTKSVDGAEFQAYIASIWLAIFLFNLVVISFDFGIGKTFSIFITIVLVVVIYIGVIDKFFENSPVPNLNKILVDFDLGASANFYLAVSLILTLLFIIISIVARFNYWEFTSNRIIHHKGVFEREESFSAQHSRVITRVEDIFERILFRAGTIHIVDSEKNVHILRNVYNAVGKDKQIQKLLSVMKVSY